MNKKVLIGAVSLSLAFSAMAGALAFNKAHRGYQEVRADNDSICFKDYELLDHIGEPYTPEGATGSVTVTTDAENDKYVITFDSFVVTTSGTLGKLGTNTSCLFYCDTAKDIVVNLKGASQMYLKETESIVLEQYCAYFNTNNVYFQNDPSSNDEEQGKLVIAVMTGTIYNNYTPITTSESTGGNFYGIKSTGNIEVSKCYLQSSGAGALGFATHKAYGVYLKGDLTIKDNATFKGTGGYASLIKGTGNAEAYGTYSEEGTITLESGLFYCLGGNAYGNASKPGRNVGAYANTIIQEDGKFEIYSGNIYNAGFDYDGTMREGRGFNIGIICNSYTVNGGEVQLWASDEYNITSYGIMGINSNSVVTINSTKKLDIQGQYIYHPVYNVGSKEAKVFHNIKLANPTMHGLALVDDRANWKNGGEYTKINPNATPITLNANIRKIWFATIQGTATQAEAEKATYDGEEHELFTCEFKEVTNTEAVIMCSVGEEDEYTQGIPKFINAGTYTVKYYFAPNPENQVLCDGYNPTPVQTATFTLYKANPTLTAPTAKEGLKADGKTSVELINPGSSTTSIVVYRLGESGEFSEAIPTVKEPGTYTVYYKAEENADYNESEVGSVQVVVIPAHEHNWSYTASGATITAKCNAADCTITEGLTLTLKAPTGDMHYDGNAKAATLQEGYSAEAFPNSEIKYFKDNAEVNECVNVGQYNAKVTCGGATAQVNFEILGKIVKDITTDVSIEIDDVVVSDDVSIKVEIRPEVKEKEIEADYQKIMNMISDKEKIAKVYDVKLIRTVGGVEEVIQPSDIQKGLKIKVRMAIPEGVAIDHTRILHIHSADDMEFVDNYKTEGNDLIFEVDRLSQFAFVTMANAKTPGNGAHGFCFGIILMIINILITLAGAFYVLLRLNVLKIEKMNAFKEKMMALEVLLTFITACALFANFVLDLVFLILHACPFTIIAFILGVLLLGGIMFWYVKTRMKGQMTLVESKVASKFKKKEAKDSSENK